MAAEDALKAIAQVDATHAAKTIRIPTLYLRATEDRMEPAAAGETYARLVPGGRIVDVAGPHFLLQANPGSAAQVIREFMQRVV